MCLFQSMKFFLIGYEMRRMGSKLEASVYSTTGDVSDTRVVWQTRPRCDDESTIQLALGSAAFSLRERQTNWRVLAVSLSLFSSNL